MVKLSYRNIWIIFIQCRTQFVQSYNRFNQYRCMGFFKEGNSMTNKEKEMIEEAIKILGMYDRSCKISMGMAMANTRKFLKDNFLNEERSDEWRINQFNRNRKLEDQVSTIEEMENKVKEMYESEL